MIECVWAERPRRNPQPFYVIRVPASRLSLISISYFTRVNCHGLANSASAAPLAMQRHDGSIGYGPPRVEPSRPSASPHACPRLPPCLTALESQLSEPSLRRRLQHRSHRDVYDRQTRVTRKNRPSGF